MSKFKVGDWVVCTECVDSFPNKDAPIRVSEVWNIFYLMFEETGNIPWDANNFKLYFKMVGTVKRVPDNMEIVDYQIDTPAGWIVVDRKSYEWSRKSGWNTRILYAFKQD